MYAQFYAGMPWADLPVFALLLFLTTFVVVVIRLFAIARQPDLEHAARLPFDAQEQVHTTPPISGAPR